MEDRRPLEVAIIGGGITGVSLALGLSCRNIRFTIYERASGFHEIGAGIGFTRNAERAMQELDPRILHHFRDVAVKNNDDWFRYVDGYNYNHNDPTDTTEELICEMYLGDRGFEGCRRSDFLLGLVSLLPTENIRFQHNLETIQDIESEDQVLMRFEGGLTANADIVIGCDGINSRLRHIMFGATHPHCKPAYAHKFAFRGLIPADKTRSLLGDYKTTARFMHMGPDAHMVTFPVAQGILINVVAFVTDPKPWDGNAGRLVMPAKRSEAVEAFSAFGPAARHIISLLPEDLDKWAIFDLLDNPLPTFINGRLCLAGDAAHASSPHHGAGAGCGVEDALALSELLAAVNRNVTMAPKTLIPAVMAAYNEVRFERCLWLMESSRIVGEMYEWQHQETKDDKEKWCREFKYRCHKIWDFDVREMVHQGLEAFNYDIMSLKT